MGYQYKMRAVYAHFPISCAITEAGTQLEVRNFLGEKFIRRVKMHDGVTVENSKAQKDGLIVSGNDIEKVSLSAALIQQSSTRISGSSWTACTCLRRPLLLRMNRHFCHLF